jgi:hypothetical protein
MATTKILTMEEAMESQKRRVVAVQITLRLSRLKCQRQDKNNLLLHLLLLSLLQAILRAFKLLQAPLQII